MLLHVLLTLSLAHLTLSASEKFVIVKITGHIGNTGLYTCLSPEYELKSRFGEQLCHDIHQVLPVELGLKDAFAECKVKTLAYQPTLVEMKLVFHQVKFNLSCTSIVPLFHHIVDVASIHQRGRYAFVGPLDIHAFNGEEQLDRVARDIEEISEQKAVYGENVKELLSVLEIAIRPERPALAIAILNHNLEEYITYALLDVLPKQFGVKEAFVDAFMNMPKQILVIRLRFLKRKLNEKGTDIKCRLFHEIYHYFLSRRWPYRSLFKIRDVELKYKEENSVIRKFPKLNHLPAEITVILEGKLCRVGKLIKGCHPEFDNKNTEIYKEIERTLCQHIHQSLGDILKWDCVATCSLIDLYRHGQSAYNYKLAVTFSALFLRTTGIEYRCSTFINLFRYELQKNEVTKTGYHMCGEITFQLLEETCSDFNTNSLYLGHLTITGKAATFGDGLTVSQFLLKYKEIAEQLFVSVSNGMPPQLSFRDATANYSLAMVPRKKSYPQAVLTIALDERRLERLHLDASCQTLFTIVRHFASRESGNSNYTFDSIDSIKYGRTLKTLG